MFSYRWINRDDTRRFSKFIHSKPLSREIIQALGLIHGANATRIIQKVTRLIYTGYRSSDNRSITKCIINTHSTSLMQRIINNIKDSSITPCVNDVYTYEICMTINDFDSGSYFLSRVKTQFPLNNTMALYLFTILCRYGTVTKNYKYSLECIDNHIHLVQDFFRVGSKYNRKRVLGYIIQNIDNTCKCSIYTRISTFKHLLKHNYYPPYDTMIKGKKVIDVMSKKGYIEHLIILLNMQFSPNDARKIDDSCRRVLIEAGYGFEAVSVDAPMNDQVKMFIEMQSHVWSLKTYIKRYIWANCSESYIRYHVPAQLMRVEMKI